MVAAARLLNTLWLVDQPLAAWCPPIFCSWSMRPNQIVSRSPYQFLYRYIDQSENSHSYHKPHHWMNNLISHFQWKTPDCEHDCNWKTVENPHSSCLWMRNGTKFEFKFHSTMGSWLRIRLIKTKCVRWLTTRQNIVLHGLVTAWIAVSTILYIIWRID